MNSINELNTARTLPLFDHLKKTPEDYFQVNLEKQGFFW